MGFDQGLDIVEAASLGEASHSEVLGVARGERRGVLFGKGGVDL